MTLLLNFCAFALALTMLLSLYRVVRGPTYFDRLTGLGLIGTKTVVLIVIAGVMRDRAGDYVDIALTYALVSFVGTVALAKYFERNRQHS